MFCALKRGKSNGLNMLALLCTTERTEINVNNSTFTRAFLKEIVEIFKKTLKKNSNFMLALPFFCEQY